MPDLFISLSLLLNLILLILLFLSYQRLSALQIGQEQLTKGFREEITRLREDMLRTQKEGREELSAHLASQLQTEIRLLESFSNQLSEHTRLNDEKLERIRGTVEGQLASLREENGKKLEEMRQTVDDKLQSTLEKRLGESFRLVSERLELVHKGLGEMQNLALGVGDLKKVLTNVKTRGTLGEIQLEALLEQILSPEQYEKNVAPRKGSGERVEFVVKLPGKKGEKEGTVFLPIDAKFPLEDYQRLQEAEERGDATKTQEALKQLEGRIRQEAKRIQEKYISPPDTTDFALLFLPVEGLYAEVLRRPGLWEELQRVYRVVITGPTTLTALLNSLQMGFRTLAIQKRSSEVWQLLGAVKTEFNRFGAILEKTQKKLQEASNTIEDAAKKSRTIERKLRSVEALPDEEAPTLLEEAEVS
ncbi:DNA recombination protein RmuC [Thermicanus aegyptius]|uniref:DNA recombination protein RmuC n=1 Tax=Thermicanus aegyptius TaxID=94009 RepID=UPI000417FF27|nr:DNA recombination protein RmuC [Thermicanus aegyptius]